MHQPERRRNERIAYHLLPAGFVAAPLAAGIDKFAGKLGNWDRYLADGVADKLPVKRHSFMEGVGLVEVAAGLIVAFKPRWGAYIVNARSETSDAQSAPSRSGSSPATDVAVLGFVPEIRDDPAEPALEPRGPPSWTPARPGQLPQGVYSRAGARRSRRHRRPVSADGSAIKYSCGCRRKIACDSRWNPGVRAMPLAGRSGIGVRARRSPGGRGWLRRDG